jgi:SAM-dependent methyltransferase
MAVDIGCGFGWFCRWARRQGAATVPGIDVSEKMLARAGATTPYSMTPKRRVIVGGRVRRAGRFRVDCGSQLGALHVRLEMGYRCIRARGLSGKVDIARFPCSIP